METPAVERLTYRPDLEGLRAIAVLLVVAAHANVPGAQGGFVGVDVFFVLSGYLITALLTLEMRAAGTVDFWTFYARRLRRLAPGLLLMLLAACLLARFVFSPTRQMNQADSAAVTAVWASNFHFAFANMDYFGPAAESNVFLHTWSLGVEEQFYLVWPLLLWLTFAGVSRRSGSADGVAAARPRRLKTVMALIFACSLALCLWLMRAHPLSAFYMMPARAWQFSLGALAWLYFPPQTSTAISRAERIWPWLGWFGLLLIALAAFGYGTNAPYPGWRALPPSLGAALVIAAGSRPAGTRKTGAFPVSALLSLRPMQALGRVSYSWYLWHWPILVVGGAIYVQAGLSTRIALALFSLALAAISYRCVELPLRRCDALLRRPWRMVTGTAAVLILAGGLALQWGNQAMQEQFDPAYAWFGQARRDMSELYAHGCDTWYHSAEVMVCQFGDEQAPHTAVLMGDSIGAQWFPAMKPRFTQAGWRLLVITKSACPMVEKPVFYARIGKEYTVCAEWRQRALAFLREIRPDHVFLGSAATPGSGFSTADWTDGTRKVLQAIAPHVGAITLIRGTPVLPFDALDCLADETLLTRLLAKENRCSALPDNTRNDWIFAALREAADGFPNARLLDMNDAVCPDGRCSAKQDDFIVFRDGQHLTASFAARLAGPFSQRLEKLWAAPECHDLSVCPVYSGSHK
ncbi:MAG: acyltransferase [Candidatus Accumulibacter sp.]|jgi:peptidoglycan/LPS O-acetylase OafA/YrhL|nr:acyltransferase [Accumulibacter sp.]